MKLIFKQKLKLKPIYTISAMLIVVLFIVYNLHKKPPQSSRRQESNIVVSTYTITNKQWQSDIQAIGNVKASKSIIISSEVPGIITNINFESGQSVVQGQILVALRADSIKAALAKAQATLKDDLSNYQRRKSLLPMHYISVADVEHFKAIVEKDQADVKQQEALLAQHVASVPFTGILGIWQVQAGQYINAGQSLVNLESIDPVYVDFSIPEKWVNRIKLDTAVEIKSDAYAGETFTGRIMATSNAIDINNRSLQVRAVVPNPQKKLLSGMAVNVSLNQPNQNKIIVPQAALAYTPDGVGVYIIDQQKVAHWHSVIVSERQRDEAIILSGLKIGDTVVIAGQQKLQDGMHVAINNQDLMMG